MPTESRVVEFCVIMFFEGHLVQDCGPGSGLYLPSQEAVNVCVQSVCAFARIIRTISLSTGACLRIRTTTTMQKSSGFCAISG